MTGYICSCDRSASEGLACVLEVIRFWAVLCYCTRLLHIFGRESFIAQFWAILIVRCRWRQLNCVEGCGWRCHSLSVRILPVCWCRGSEPDLKIAGEPFLGSALKPSRCSRHKAHQHPTCLHMKGKIQLLEGGVSTLIWTQGQPDLLSISVWGKQNHLLPNGSIHTGDQYGNVCNLFLLWM